MTHLPFIIAAYVIAVLLPAGFALAAVRRLRLVERRLEAVDPRRRR